MIFPSQKMSRAIVMISCSGDLFIYIYKKKLYIFPVMFKYLIDHMFQATLCDNKPCTTQIRSKQNNACLCYSRPHEYLVFLCWFSLECVCQSQHKGQTCSTSKQATPHPLPRRGVTYWDTDDLVAWLVRCYFSGTMWRVLDSCSGHAHMCLRTCCDRVSGREKEWERNGRHLKGKQLQVELVPSDCSPAKEWL